MKSLSKWFPVKRRPDSNTDMQKYWGDYHPVLEMRREMDRLFNDFLQDPFSALKMDWSRPLVSADLNPNVDIKDKGRELKVSVELPGMDSDDVDVSLSDNVLRIKGEKKSEDTSEDDGYYMSERFYGAFERVIPLPVEVIADKVKAKFKKGVLTIRLPKTKKAAESVRKISVQSED